MVRRSPAAGGRRGLPRWAWIVTGLVVGLALVGGVSAWYQGNPRTGEPAATSPAPTAAAAAVPNGCLAGPLNDADGLLQAQKDAPPSQAGAIGFGAAVLRWTAQYPRSSAKDGAAVAGSVLAKGATGTIADMATTMSSPDTYPGVTSGSLNFADGRYMVEEATPDMVRFTAGGEIVQNGKPAGMNFASTLTMVWEDGLWKVRSDATERTTDDLFANGSAFAGGC
jgi:hypothetical protein